MYRAAHSLKRMHSTAVEIVRFWDFLRNARAGVASAVDFTVLGMASTGGGNG